MAVETVGTQQINPVPDEAGDSDGTVKPSARQPPIYDTSQSPQTADTGSSAVAQTPPSVDDASAAESQPASTGSPPAAKTPASGVNAWTTDSQRGATGSPSFDEASALRVDSPGTDPQPEPASSPPVANTRVRRDTTSPPSPPAGTPGNTLQEPGAQGNFANFTSRDNAIGDKIDHLRDLQETGYPQDTKDFNGRISDLQRLVVPLPSGEREFYAGAVGALSGEWATTADPARHAELSKRLTVIEDSARDASNRVGSDPREATLAAFTAPRGEGYLDSADQQQLKELSKLREDYLKAKTPAERQTVYQNALQTRASLQDRIGAAVDKNTADEQSKWDAAHTDVDRIIREAEGVTDDPGKRVVVIARELHTTSPGSGRDDSADRRILDFTERLGKDEALREKIKGWEGAAGTKLNEYGVDAGKSYLHIPDNLPAPGPDYVRDLGDQYDGLLKDNTYKNYSITPQARAEHIVNRVMEGAVRFALGMTPLAPLASLLDKNSVLTDNEKNGIAWGSALAGLATGSELGEAGNISKPISKIIQEEQLADDATIAAGKTGQHVGKDVKDFGGGGEGAPEIEPPNPASGTPHSNVPESYATKPDGGLTPDPHSVGIFRDGKNQAFVHSGKQTYPVRWDKDNRTWRVFQPNDPTKPQYPVRMGRDGHWQEHNDVGLPGGMDNGSSSSSESSMAKPFADRYQVSSSTGAPPSAAMQQTLDPVQWTSDADSRIDDPAFVDRYRTVFNNLPAEQRRAIRDWTHVDVGDDSDGYSTDGSYQGINYDLNKQLYSRDYEADTSRNALTLRQGLDRLPTLAGQNRLLRYANVDPNYASKFAPGDYVTNSPAFMSVSSQNWYANANLADTEWAGAAAHPVAIYDIQTQSAKPFITNITTLADGEREWLIKPNTVFRVDEIATATPNDAAGTTRYGIRLTEVPITGPMYAKNIQTGEQELVYPQGVPVVIRQLQTTRNPTLKAPPAQDPNLPPPPTHGDPNAGTSRV
ncbi:hypothetical protein RI103_12790 [Paraburkholderia sp. FT54]|uniref:hypothetical protein n=1 Tax=Paraburkholderia sp. FT54 TaxID=3074437 RepID=UPI002877298A|nr:hypothetical protein [Paraburkholderia sp. FT54]WNC88590.1 hypothetical protein RI103_12790 [Paraburkholderia sp. FT54]